MRSSLLSAKAVLYSAIIGSVAPTSAVVVWKHIGRRKEQRGKAALMQVASRAKSTTKFPLMTFYAENDKNKDCAATNTLPSIEECDDAIQKLGMERKIATVNLIDSAQKLPGCYYDMAVKTAFFNKFTGTTKTLADLGGGDLYRICKQQ
ncbi:unnamed protein product [Amoebophrya sp. A25]|nr:unnamed protein product [Amoebophrya sp. A25]|eukprot:GSA25T00005556001.1